MPFVGVVPAIKPASAASHSGQVGLLATPATVNSEYTEQLVQQFATDCELVRLGSSELVHWAEQWFWQATPSLPAFPELNCFRWVDTLVLGCTHFPMIAQQIAAHLPQNVQLVDSGAAIARQVGRLLQQISATHHPKKTMASSLVLTEQQQRRLRRYGFGDFQLLPG